uniref:UvrD-helicase domain-containing protein n=3 Tax=Gelidibacter sp. TaxID=2018083 RepID=UPI00404B32BB
MPEQNAYTIYNASAGSGKTYTLVKAYLKLLFQSSNPLAFRTILALTFTNKAVAEMKERIVDTLKDFSQEHILNSDNAMFNELASDLSMTPMALHKKSQQILNTMVHNYAAFDISTIDKFNHKLIRTFAHDLKLPLNFEVELDSLNILAKAVDHLIDKAGTDKALTKVLVDFAIEKADEDKSWDVSYDFNKIAKLLINETDIPFIETIKDKTLDDFKALKSKIGIQLKSLETEIKATATEVLELITNYGLQFEDFSGGYLPKFFLKLADGDYDVSLELKWQEQLAEGLPMYPKRVPNSIASTFDELQPQLIQCFILSKDYINTYKFLKNAYKNITPVSVLNAIHQSLKTIKEEDDLMLISEFNSIIHNEIKEQPTPFIYERIGEKFKHYFIDEFQDTSVLQWENLVPLIDNALSGENLKGETGSAMIVGDAKQAIYRWRGGKAEQFIDLYTQKANPFQVEPLVANLPTNYRSLKTIVEFNNAFFKHLSAIAFSKPEHQDIYEASHQNVSKNTEGYVELSFLEISKEDDKNEVYCQNVLETIKKAESNGFSLGEICIIIRNGKEGIAIAEYLSSQNIPIVSSESLLLKNSPEVQFISNCMALTNQPKNALLKIEILSYLAEYQLKLDDKHAFFEPLVHLDAAELFKKMSAFGFDFNYQHFLQLPLYEAVETIIRQFHLNKTSNAYLQFYLDEVLSYSQKNNPSFSGFSAHWDIKKEKLSIVSPQNTDAVQIMTIHKSKGLEFPVVIFPYANQNIYDDRLPKTWFPVDATAFNGFSFMYINMNDAVKDYGETGRHLRETYKSEQELDSINLLYVVLTRAAEHLYIISGHKSREKKSDKLNLYSDLFIDYLTSQSLWNEGQTTYSFGQPKRLLKGYEQQASTTQEQLISVAKEAHQLHIVTSSGYLWDTEQERAIEKGNLIHLILSKIKTHNDLDYVLEWFVSNGKLSITQAEDLQPIIENILKHPKLNSYFETNWTVYNEKDIFTKNNITIRPDRLNINQNNEVIIIDYKTGVSNKNHKAQLDAYQSIIEEMTFKVTKKILIYINEIIEVEEF